MNFTDLFIRRPVMTVLLNLAIVLAGLVALSKLPVAALPSYNTPVIQVSAVLPGAAPETMASSVALPLEKQFSTIAGLATISSINTLGQTSLVLEFDPSRDIEAAAVDVQAALFRAQRSLPAEMTTPPSYRKVNPADAPVLILAMTSPSMSLSELNEFAENLVSPTLSTLPGVAQVSIFGQKRYAVRVKVRPQALAERGLTIDDLRSVLGSANANTPVGVLEGPRQTLTIQANRQLASAREFGNLIVSSRDGAPVRLRDVAEVQDSIEITRSASTYNGEPSINMAVLRQPDANTVEVVDRVRALLPRFAAQLPASVVITPFNDRSVSIRDALHDVNLTLALTVVLVVVWRPALSAIEISPTWAAAGWANRAARVASRAKAFSFIDVSWGGVSVANDDAVQFLKARLPKGNGRKKAFVYLDPPYVIKGQRLYMNAYEPGDHGEIARYISSQKILPWVMSYDDADLVRGLYKKQQIGFLPINYSLQEKRATNELVIAPHHIRLPRTLRIGASKFELREVFSRNVA